jgi:nitroimidazol reductase NimA-like FMN-containing flavoprotein (pyridoxamine 5'-phosphate oxidase superfamily)
VTHDLHESLDWSGLVILDAEECYEHLRNEPVGRLGFVDRGEPVILPINYAVDGRSIVFRTGQGSKLATALMGQPVCLEIDGWDGMAHTGWSVVIKGIADVVRDEAETIRFDQLPVRPWSRPDLRRDWVRILVEEVTGRRIAPEAV